MTLRGDYSAQKGMAKQRGISWEMDFYQWLQIWEDSGQLHNRGVRKGQWVMCRPNDTGPYSPENVRIVRVETNCAEGFRTARKRAAERILKRVAPNEPPDEWRL